MDVQRRIGTTGRWASETKVFTKAITHTEVHSFLGVYFLRRKDVVWNKVVAFLFALACAALCIHLINIWYGDEALNLRGPNISMGMKLTNI